MVISLPGDVLFDSGRETLKKDGKDILAQGRGRHQGRPAAPRRATTRSPATPTTSRSQHGPFKDNWGLSLMRAREVLVFLVDPDKGGGFPSSTGAPPASPTPIPIASNDTDDGRQKNRRCELIVVPSVEEMLDLKAITQ